jgi:hypothetical protein
LVWRLAITFISGMSGHRAGTLAKDVAPIANGQVGRSRREGSGRM